MSVLKPLVLATALFAGSATLTMSAGASAPTAADAMPQAAATNDMGAASMARGQGGKVSKAARGFMNKAATGGMSEVALSQLAQQKSSNDEVKKFAARMVDDHTRANDELATLALSEGVSLPNSPTAAQKQAMAQLEGMSGDSFDHAYMKQMVIDHKKTIALFEKGAKMSNADVTAFADKTLPTLKEHLQMAHGVVRGMAKG